ncbi:Diadenosine hexaphosphate hydrolase [Psilocybe cubensis]|uniref:Nudix hydrolase domain-containing protein n=2 Tax=Psilocybe cubensis TaxID=181762 RepID=A0A8H8CF84_PSICU|nr:Diadenosine hexaphosphate hydrolase [Psilocybe cubensis]KAH9477119.1 Diadenosine hexaphosphate hydrolase [Psilocybe cubensis]
MESNTAHIKATKVSGQTVEEAQAETTAQKASTDCESEVNQFPPIPVPSLSKWSTPAIPENAWCSTDFMTGAGMVVIQQNTEKIIVLYSTMMDYWFFPRGRKDIGECIEQAALREAHEESGYRVHFLPVVNPTRQPHPTFTNGNNQTVLNTEPIFMTTTNKPPGESGPDDYGKVYLTLWFIGQIPEDAKFEAGTRTDEEFHFETHLLSYDEAVKKIWYSERPVLKYAWHVYQKTLEFTRSVPRD